MVFFEVKQITRLGCRDELDVYPGFNPDNWLDSVRCKIEGNVQKIEISEAISVADNSTSTEISRSTHKCA